MSLHHIECRVRYARYLLKQLDSITDDMVAEERDRANSVVSLIIEGLSEGYIELTPHSGASAVAMVAHTAALKDPSDAVTDSNITVDTPAKRCYSVLQLQSQQEG